ncbi:MAG TPA: pyridoxal-phosphate dependent enzyme [Candidatus Desulfaltia sp.]|nr:pyridoxal-phosphate dependent enzyme [Candidatus Desulfaltia sp.]
MSLDWQEKIIAAYGRIGPDIRRTPLEFSPALSALTGAEVFLKWESEQRTGSFKFRGALNKIRSLSPEERNRGVVSASTGNHGLGISLAAEMESLPLALVLPQNVSAEKKRRLEEGPAEIIVHGESCDKAEIWARCLAEETGKTFISPYNDEDIIAGQGTIGLEIYEDLPDVEAALVPVGGGGLIAGIAGYLKASGRTVEVSGVEPSCSGFMAASLAAGHIVEIEEGETIAEAVAGGIEPGSITFPLCRELLDRIILVEEPLLKRAMSLILELHQRMVEGAGALSLAGLLEDRSRFQAKKTVLVVSGGNIAARDFRDAMRSP